MERPLAQRGCQVNRDPLESLLPKFGALFQGLEISPEMRSYLAKGALLIVAQWFATTRRQADRAALDQRIYELRSQGLSCDEVANRVGRDRSSVFRAYRRELSRRKRAA